MTTWSPGVSTSRVRGDGYDGDGHRVADFGQYDTAPRQSSFISAPQAETILALKGRFSLNLECFLSEGAELASSKP